MAKNCCKFIPYIFNHFFFSLFVFFSSSDGSIYTCAPNETTLTSNNQAVIQSELILSKHSEGIKIMFEHFVTHTHFSLVESLHWDFYRCIFYGQTTRNICFRLLSRCLGKLCCKQTNIIICKYWARNSHETSFSSLLLLFCFSSMLRNTLSMLVCQVINSTRQFHLTV